MSCLSVQVVGKRLVHDVVDDLIDVSDSQRDVFEFFGSHEDSCVAGISSPGVQREYRQYSVGAGHSEIINIDPQ